MTQSKSSLRGPLLWVTVLGGTLLVIAVWLGLSKLIGDVLGIGYILPGLALLGLAGLWYGRRYGTR